jgi:peroxidase
MTLVRVTPCFRCTGGTIASHVLGAVPTDLTKNALENGNTIITIPNVATDPFIAGNCPDISFARSDFVVQSFGGSDVRQQVNVLTAFIDASNVYGSDKERCDALRSFTGGKLLTDPSGNLPPKNVNNLPNGPSGDHFFLLGENRANEQAGLTAIHTLFVREHNRLAGDIAAFYPQRTDEEIFQLARKLVIGEMQAITYKEFLPAVIGPLTPSLDAYDGYNASVDPRIANEFSTIAFRVGHTMLTTNISLANSQGPFGTVKLRDIFFDPAPFDNDHLYVDHILGGLMASPCQEIDAFVVDDVRNFLFGAANGPGTCLDLISLNIQVCHTEQYGWGRHQCCRLTFVSVSPMSKSERVTMAYLSTTTFVRSWV